MLFAMVGASLACTTSAFPETAENRSNDAGQSSGRIDTRPPPELEISALRRAIAELEAENQELKSKNAEARLGYLRFYYEKYLPKKAEAQLEAFYWQRRTSEVLLWIVVAVCLSGVLFSGFQLWRATKNSGSLSSSMVQRDETGATPLATSLELSSQQFRVTSSVVGIIVLLISVAYLYLFLKDVYQIQFVDSNVESPARRQSTPPSNQ